MNYLITAITISFLILIHETGHFIAALIAGIPVARFSIGFGPKLFAFMRKGTEYRLSMIPLGGYVLPEVKDEQEFFQYPVHKRIIFSVGGSLANILLAVFLVAFLNVIAGNISFQALCIYPFTAVFLLTGKIIAIIPGIFTGASKVSGIVGIMAQGSSFMKDIPSIINFCLMLSINLAIFNFFPIPALDGGKILLYLFEKLHPKLLKLHVSMSIIGWVFLFFILIYTTIQDIDKYIVKIFS
jgi:regulator of sigma E protease